MAVIEYGPQHARRLPLVGCPAWPYRLGHGCRPDGGAKRVGWAGPAGSLLVAYRWDCPPDAGDCVTRLARTDRPF